MTDPRFPTHDDGLRVAWVVDRDDGCYEFYLDRDDDHLTCWLMEYADDGLVDHDGWVGDDARQLARDNDLRLSCGSPV